MASLDDFTLQSSATLDDFQIEGPLVPVNNRPSNVNMAAYTAALSENPESVEAAYLQNAQAFEQGNRDAMEEVQGRARQVVRERSAPALANLLADSTVSDEEKQAAIEAYRSESAGLFSLRNVAATEALVSESYDETVESADARVKFADVIDRVNASRRAQNIALNQALAEQDPSMLELGAGFLEIIAPYAEQTITGNIVRQIRDGDASAFVEAFALMGEGKTSIPDMLTRLPPEERGPLTQKIIDAVNESSTLVFADENDFVRMDVLRTMLEEGYYTETDRWIDNLVSVAEMVGLPLGSAVSAVRASRRAKRIRDASVVAPSSSMSDEALRSAEDAAEEEALRRAAEREDAARQTSGQAAASDDELRAAEDAAEARANARTQQRREEAQETGGNAVASDDDLRAAEDAVAGRQANDPVRRAEDAAERRAEARRAVYTDDDSLRALEDAEVRKNRVRSTVNPVSLAKTYHFVNPGKARAANAMVTMDRTDTTAEALYGTDRVDAVASDSLPEMPSYDGGVEGKATLPDAERERPLPANPRVMDTASRNGAIHLTPAEKEAVATRVVNDFNHVMGVTTRTEMTVPKVDDIGNQIAIGVVYGPKDNGWADGAAAVEKVKTSLRDYGVRDSDITLLERKGERYVPAKGQPKTDGDYLVKVDYPYTISGGEFKDGDWSDLDVRNNFFDRMPHALASHRQGSFQRHILDAHSMLHPNITFGANVAVDRTSQLEKDLLDLSDSFSRQYANLNGKSQLALEAEIKRANFEGRNATTTELRAKGFGNAEVNTLKAWREVWDTMYWLENRDMVKTLRNRNYGVMEDPVSGTRLFARELPRNKAGAARRAYDPETGKMETLSDEELTELYRKGGSVATLRSKIVENGEAVETVISRNQPGGPFIRKLRDDDQVLNYREGYYTVYYEDPKIVERVVKDSQGNILSKGAIATAKDTPSAERFKNRFQDEAEENVEYVVRDNRERMRFDSQDNWDLQDAAGRTAQRVRGQRLQDASSPITDEAHNNILGPVDALIRSARSVATRVGMRDYLETGKMRAISQYGHMFPKDQYGRPQFPAHSGQIQGTGPEAAAARTTVEYFHTLEHGYVNGVDAAISSGFRMIADLMGEKNNATLERAFNFASGFGASNAARGTAFTLYLALNPLRQFIVQSHQAIQLLALRPQYAAGRLAGDMALMLEMAATNGKLPKGQAKLLKRSEAEVKEMFEAFNRSGLFASIDKSNLVRGTLSEVADSSARGGFRRSPVRRGLGYGARAIGASRKAGFDLGEQINMLSSWLTHYDMAKSQKKGGKLSESDLDMVTARARDFTYNMNRAGEMPYNENWAGMMFQFMQVPHKAALQMTTSRTLTKSQKARIAAFNLTWYGLPPTAFFSSMMQDVSEDNPELKDALTLGLESYMFNKAASVLLGEEVGIDFSSSLSATDMTGLVEFVGNIITGDVGGMLAEAPSTSLVAGSNPRVTNFANTVAEYFHFKPALDQNPADAKELGLSFLKLASGASNALKARVAYQQAQKISSSGAVTDADVNVLEAFATAAGFSTVDEMRKYWVGGELYEARTEFKEDVAEVYRLVKRQLAAEGIDNQDGEYLGRVINVGLEQFAGNPNAYREFVSRVQYDIQDGNLSMIQNLIRAGGIMEPGEARNLVRNAPISDAERERLMQYYDMMDAYTGE